MNYTGKYSHLLEEVEKELQGTREENVKDALRLRMKLLDELKIKVNDLEKEVRQLLKSGKITDLSTLIRVDEGEDKGIKSHMALKRDEKSKGDAYALYIQV